MKTNIDRTMVDLINTNLTAEEGTFHYHLREYGIFDKKKLDELIKFVFKLNNQAQSKIDRLEKSVQLWELTYHIENLLISHYHKNDLFVIEGGPEEEILQLRKLLFYISNWFTYGKEMKEEFLKLDKW